VKRRVAPVTAIAAIKAQQVVVKTNRPRAGTAWHDHDFLFVAELGEPFTRSNINHAIKIVGRRAGVERVHAHRWRRTTATYMHARRVPLATDDRSHIFHGGGGSRTCPPGTANQVSSPVSWRSRGGSSASVLDRSMSRRRSSDSSQARRCSSVSKRKTIRYSRSPAGGGTTVTPWWPG